MTVKQAQNFIIDRTLQPAIDSPATSDRIKHLTTNSMRWVRKFKRTGDLIAYMDRFQGDAPQDIVDGLREAGVETFEEIHDEFQALFGGSVDDRTRLDDFVVGRRYTAYDINIFARRYDLRSGGILPIGPFGQHAAVFIKATLTGGTYPNMWIEEGRRLRYYLKSISGKFDEGFQDNRSIINHPDVPVYAFVREKEGDPFVLSGVFKLEKIHTEDDGSKWFELLREEVAATSAAITLDEFDKSTKRRVRNSLQSSQEARKERLRTAPKKPRKLTVLVEAYVRNSDVIAEVLERAAGRCEGCEEQAPFNRRSDGTPYLEVHHKVPLSLDGDDSVENAVALCPNCHRREHYGPAMWSPIEGDLNIEIE